MISGEEFERRLRMISQLRAFALALRESARKAYSEGKIPYKPGYDMRSDYEYWKRLADEKAEKGSIQPMLAVGNVKVNLSEQKDNR